MTGWSERPYVSQQQIPVIVLAGFLGSGKTTLLNHLLHSSRGSRIGAVVNDFGSIEIDAMAVAGQLGDSTVALGNGCLCCSVDVSELDTYLERLTRPATGIDVVVIEASGLAEPGELMRMVLASENPRVRYGGLVEVVDAAEFTATRERHPELDRHLGVADLVVLNKTDRVPAAERELTFELVRSLTDRAAVVSASYGRIDPELLFDRKVVTERVGQLSFDDLRDENEQLGGARGNTGHDPHPDGDDDGDAGQGVGSGHGHEHGASGHVHLHTAYDSVAFTSAVPLDPRRTMAFLDSRPLGLYRIKGYVDFGAADTRHRYEVHAVGRFLAFAPEPWPAEEERRTQLVLIGTGIDVESLTAGLEACRVAEGRRDATDERAMWGVLRYVRHPGTDDAATAEYAEPEHYAAAERGTPTDPAAGLETEPAEAGAD